MDINILGTILVVFFAALMVTMIFRQLHLSVILGYLLVGALVGPHALGLVPDSHAIKQLAEFGIVFLMFTVGLEFSLPKLFSLKYSVFVIGGLQVSLCIIITTIIGIFLGMSILSSLVTGSIVAMSSTAIVVKQLNDQLELHSSHGLNAVGILLFQDLAVIPVIILIAGLANKVPQNLVVLLLGALVKGVLAIFLIFLMGRWLLKPLFHIISKTRAIELFTLTVLLVTLTAAWLTNIFGLSYALGAFLAGLMLAETEFRHQIEVEIRPFRDILLGLFFITIGMLANVETWYQTWFWIALLVSALVLGKMLLITVLALLSRNNASTSIRTGLVLAQGSEFGFAILTLALNDQVLPKDYGQVTLAALVISIALSPLLIRFNKQIADFLLPKKIKLNDTQTKQKIIVLAKKLNQHIVICGYGRVGQHIARMLDKINFPYIGLDLDSELVQRASMAGDNIIYGDPTHPGILEAAGLTHAKVLVISFNDLKSTIKVLEMVKQSHPDLPILVRCRDEFELKELKKYGATQIIAELFEESLTLSHHLLNLIKVPASKISELMHEVRSKDYDLLHKVFTGSYYDQETSTEGLLREQLKPISIPENAYAVNRTLKELELEKTGAEIVAIRRGDKKHLKPRANIKLYVNDIVIVFGSVASLGEVEKKLLEGN